MKNIVISTFLPISILLLTHGCATDTARSEYVLAKNILTFSHDKEEALPLLRRAVEKEPSNNEFREVYWATLDSISKQKSREAFYLIKSGKYAEAENKIKKLKKLNPHYPQLSNITQFLDLSKKHDRERNYAIQLFNSHEYERAYDILSHLLSSSADDTEARLLLEKIQNILVDTSNKINDLNKIFGKKISLEYQNVPLKIILKTLSNVTGINFFFDQDVRLNDPVTIISKDNSVKDTISVICLSHNLRTKILNKNSIIFFPDIPSKIRKYENLAVRTFHITKGNINKIAESIKTILHLRDVSVDEKTGYLIVRATPDTIGAVEHLISIEDQEAPEVELELEVLEVAHSDARSLGIEWPNDFSFSVISTGTPASTTLDKLLSIGKSDILVTGLQGSASASESLNHSSLLADPRIRVKDNEKAEIQIGERLPLKNSTTTSTGLISDSVSYIDVGLKLEVKPKISFDQNVTISLKLEVSSMLSKQDLGNGSFGYDIGTRNVSTTLQLMNNETQILGGLLKNSNIHNNAGYPGIARIPLLGYIFGKKSFNTEQNEIILAITPHIIHPVKAINRLDQNFSSGTEESIQLKTTQNILGTNSNPPMLLKSESVINQNLLPSKEHKTMDTSNTIHMIYDSNKPYIEHPNSATFKSEKAVPTISADATKIYQNGNIALPAIKKLSSLVPKQLCSINYKISDKSEVVLSRSEPNNLVWDLKLVNIPDNTKNLLIDIWFDKNKVNFIKPLPGSLATIKEPLIEKNKNNILINIYAIDGFSLPVNGLAAQLKFDNSICTNDIRMGKIEKNVQ